MSWDKKSGIFRKKKGPYLVEVQSPGSTRWRFDSKHPDLDVAMRRKNHIIATTSNLARVSDFADWGRYY